MLCSTGCLWCWGLLCFTHVDMAVGVSAVSKLVSIHQRHFVPVSCFCISTESVSWSNAAASVMPPLRCMASLALLLLKDRLRRAAEAVWLTWELGLRSRATRGGIPFSFITCGIRRRLEQWAHVGNTPEIFISDLKLQVQSKAFVF